MAAIPGWQRRYGWELAAPWFGNLTLTRVDYGYLNFEATYEKTR
jgi:hypothetical protein